VVQKYGSGVCGHIRNAFVAMVLKLLLYYDEFMKQIRTVRHNFNITGTANYRVQLAVPPLTKNNCNNRNHNNTVLNKKLKKLVHTLKN